MIYLFALSLILLVYLTDAKLPRHFRRLLPVLLFVSIPLFGSSEIKMFGLESNLGNLFFAAVTMALTLKVLRYGREFGQEFIHLSLFSLAVMTFISGFSGYLIGKHIVDIRLLIAAFVSFYFVQSGFVYVLEKIRNSGLNTPAPLVILTVILMQAIDSLIFFPLAFAGSGIDVFNYALNGFIIKSLFAVVAQPFICHRWSKELKDLV